MISRRQASAGDPTWQDSWIKRAQAKQPQRGGFPKALAGASMQYSTRQAPSRGVSELLEAYRESAWLRAVVDRIGYHFAIVPWQLHERPDKSSDKRLHTRKFRGLRGGYRHKNISNALRLGELREIDQHPLLDLLNCPNDQMGGVAFRDMCCKFVDFTGECFMLVVKDALGIPYQLWPIVPTWVYRIPNIERPIYDLSVLGRSLTVPQDQIIYIRRHELLNPYTRGAGMGVALGDTIDMDHYAHKFLKSTYFNGARPDMIISLPGATEDVVADFQQKFENQTRGPLRAHRTFFADSEIDLKELSNETGINQSIPLLDHIRDTFISVYGVPPEIMGVLENANRATINQAMTIFARETLMPRLELFADEWQRQLVPLFDSKLLLSYTNPVPEDDDYRLDVAKAAPWSLSNREWRQLGGWSNPASEPEFHMVPVGMTATEDPSKPILAPGQPNAPGSPTPPATPAQPAAPSAPAAPKPEEVPPMDASAQSRHTKSPEDGDAAALTNRILRAFAPDYLTDELDPVWQDSVKEWGDQTLAELGIEARFDMQNPAVKQHLKDFAGDRIDGINDTTKDSLRDTLIEGFKAGEGYRDLADRVKECLAADDARAEMIARTEVMRSSNFASYSAYKSSGVVGQKQWIATISDARTRDSHREMNGVTVGIDDDFECEGATSAYPGDFGDPALDINCRCTVGPVVDNPDDNSGADDDSKAMKLATLWKAYDHKVKGWESRAKTAVLKGFKRQQRAILSALHRIVHA